MAGNDLDERLGGGGFITHRLDEVHRIYQGELPSELAFDRQGFESIWETHPDDYHKIKIHGRLVETPRWQQAYGKDYHYTGRVNKALPMLPELCPILSWCQSTIDPRLNGVLLIWYDGAMGHYIGAHRDSTTNMCEGAPIVTISLGESRMFRLRPWKGRGFTDFGIGDGTVLVMPYDTNLAWTHEVPKAKRFQGRRISITLRAFE